MKKTVISVLVVLLLSVMVLGCPTGPCDVCGEEPCICKAATASNLSALAIADLKTMGENTDTFPTPLGTTFDKYKYASATSMICIVWKDANEAMFDHYKEAWASRARASVSDNSSFAMATIDFFSTGGTIQDWEVAYNDGSIVFIGKKQ